MPSDAGQAVGAAASFRMLADAAPVMLWTADANGRRVFFNAAWYDFTGWPRGEAPAEDWPDAIHAEDRASCLDAYRVAIQRRESFRAQYRLRHADGAYRWVLDAGTPRIAADGELTGYVGSCVDVQDRVDERRAFETGTAELVRLAAQLQIALDELRARSADAEAAKTRARKSEQRSRLLDEASRLLHSSLDYRKTLRSVANLAVPSIADRCIVHLLSNDEFVRIDSEDARGSAVIDRLASRYPTWARIGPVRVMKTGAPELYVEFTDETMREAAHDEEHLRLLREAGIQSAVIVPMSIGGRVIGTLTLVSSEPTRRFGVDDLNVAEELARRAAVAVDNARLYRETEAASHAKSEFLARMSHELRTPLNAISGYTDLLQLGITDPDQQRDHLDRIKASAWHLLSMIEEILTLSRIDAGKVVAHEDTVDARDLASEAAGLLELAAAQKGLTLHVILPASPIPVVTDRAKVRQVLINLLANAVKFTSKGEIGLELEVRDDTLCYHVRDTGPGIPGADLGRIFEPFWQADSGTTRRAGGTGIGLSVAQRLAELLDGRLSVESRPDVGSTFTLEIPRRPVSP